MTDILSQLSTQLASAVDAASASIVQLHARRRPVAGVVFDTDLVLTVASAIDADEVGVRRADGTSFDGKALGQAPGAGVAVVQVPGLAAQAARPGEEPRPGALTMAVGRTWSGNVFAALAPVSVVGGPLRTGRTSELARVIRVGLVPHGALTGGALVNGAGEWLGLSTSAAIRGTMVVIPAGIAVAAAREIVARGTARRGFIGVSSMPVTLAPSQRDEARATGLLVTAVSPGGPAESAGVLVGDVLLQFDGQSVVDADDLLTQLGTDRIGRPVALSVLRGREVASLTITVQERPRR